nr:hypothetical protein CFP56_19540 [Quercus suber]
MLTLAMGFCVNAGLNMTYEVKCTRWRTNILNLVGRFFAPVTNTDIESSRFGIHLSSLFRLRSIGTAVMRSRALRAMGKEVIAGQVVHSKRQSGIHFSSRDRKETLFDNPVYSYLQPQGNLSNASSSDIEALHCSR